MMAMTEQGWQPVDPVSAVLGQAMLPICTCRLSCGCCHLSGVGRHLHHWEGPCPVHPGAPVS